MGMFIQIELQLSEISIQTAEQIVSLCPVEIFKISDQHLELQLEREDECTLCELCLKVAPAGSVVIRKLYKEEVLVAREQRESEPAS